MKFVSLAKRYLDTSRREIEGEITHFCLPNPNSYGFYSSTVCFTYPRSSRRLWIFLPDGSARHKEKGCVAKRKFCGTSFFTLNSKNESSMWNFRSVLGMQKPAHTTWMELSAEVFQFR